MAPSVTLRSVLQATVYGAFDLRLEEKPLDPDRLAANEVYVETEVTALSTGTELALYLGHAADVPSTPTYPREMGYNNVGRVVRTGAAVLNLPPGQRVLSVKSHQSAYIAPQEDLMVPVPDGVTSEAASLAYLTSLTFGALHKAGYEAGESVAVVGLGVIGMCGVAVARRLGAKVLAVTNAPERLEMARNVGAHAACLSQEMPSATQLRALFGDVGADIVVLTANSWDGFRVAVNLARRMGRVCILGLPGRRQPLPDFNVLSPEWFHGKQLSLISSGYVSRIECASHDIRFNVRRNLEKILDLMACGQLDLEPVITHRFPARRMLEAYELAAQHSKALCGAIFDWRV